MGSISKYGIYNGNHPGETWADNTFLMSTMYSRSAAMPVAKNPDIL
jgi:hypothetical protein